MTLARSDLPDFVRGMLLLGQDDAGNQVPVFVGDDGRIYVLLVGKDAGGVVRMIRTDTSGQLYAILKGASGHEVAVDSHGFMTAILKGVDPGEVLETIKVDDAGQLIMVPRGQSGYYMAVDASGFLTAVLKGQLDGVLTTIRVDSEGRIEAFGLDAENQWGITTRTGNAELACMLGSPVSYDWRGQVLLIDDFSNGLSGYLESDVGAGGDVEVSPDCCASGGFSVKLTGGSSGGIREAMIQRKIGLPKSLRLGLYVRWAAVATPEDFEIGMWARKDGYEYIAYLRYHFADSKLQYKDSTLTYQDIATVSLELGVYSFHSLKMVIDVGSGDYLRALLNGEEYDLSAYTMYAAVDAGADMARYEITCKSNSGDNDVIYVDAVVVTVNEPT